MTNAMLTAAGRWLRYRQTLRALRALGPGLHADLGLTPDKLVRIAALAARKDGAVNLFDAIRQIEDADEPLPPACEPAPLIPACRPQSLACAA